MYDMKKYAECNEIVGYIHHKLVYIPSYLVKLPAKWKASGRIAGKTDNKTFGTIHCSRTKGKNKNMVLFNTEGYSYSNTPKTAVFGLEDRN